MKTNRKTASKENTTKTSVPADMRIHPALRGFLGHCLYKLSHYLRAAFERELVDVGLLAPHFAILMMVKVNGSMTQTELGGCMAIDKATMVRFLDGLENEGYLKRTHHSSDRRAKILQLTKAGEKILTELEAKRKKVENEFFAVLTAEEKKTLHALVSKVVISD